MKNIEIERLLDRYPKATMDRFDVFHAANPDVYTEFKELAFRMVRTGRTKYSGETIFNVLRWHRDIKTSGDVFKLNDHFRSIYVRKLIQDIPSFIDFFELRQAAPNKGRKSEEQLRRERETTSLGSFWGHSR